MKSAKERQALDDKALRMRNAKARVTRIQKTIRSVAPEPEPSLPIISKEWQITEEAITR